jgi:hypothetical protein
MHDRFVVFHEFLCLMVNGTSPFATGNDITVLNINICLYSITLRNNFFFSLLLVLKYVPYINSYTLNTKLQSDLLWHVSKKKVCTCKGY